MFIYFNCLIFKLFKVLLTEENMFSKQLNEKLNKYHLLKHPFYKAWNEGKLTREVIKDYGTILSTREGFSEIYQCNPFSL